MKFYCNELKDNSYKTATEFLLAFYETGGSKATCFEKGGIQCAKGRDRSIDELVELCSNHLGTDVSVEEVVEGLMLIHQKANNHATILYCPNVRKPVYYHCWNENMPFVYTNSSCYGLVKESQYIEEGLNTSKYTLTQLVEIEEDIRENEKPVINFKEFYKTLAII